MKATMGDIDDVSDHDLVLIQQNPSSSTILSVYGNIRL